MQLGWGLLTMVILAAAVNTPLRIRSDMESNPAEPGEACEGGDGVCTFGAQTCDCRQRRWVCWNPADCPAAPAHQAACTIESMVCEYPGGECECEDAVWSCDRALRMPEEDAGA